MAYPSELTKNETFLQISNLDKFFKVSKFKTKMRKIVENLETTILKNFEKIENPKIEKKIYKILFYYYIFNEYY